MSDRPNILFIMTDQQRFDCLGANGNPLIQTPNLDALATRSANLTNMFVQAPVCVPSRVTFFTGRYPHAHRNRVNNTPLSDTETLMPAYLKDAGYTTCAVGKLHLYPPTRQEGMRRGFDTVLLQDGLPPNDPFSDYVAWRKEHDPNRHIHYKALAEDVAPGENPYRAALPEEYTETSWVGQSTREMLTRLAGGRKPFFLFSSFFKPHEPFEVPQPFDAMYNDVDIPLSPAVTMEDVGKLPLPLQTLILRDGLQEVEREELMWRYRSYYGAVSHIDREVGRILDTLEDLGRADDTILVFASDHGDQLWEHGVSGKNVFFESSVHVPFLVSFPGAAEAGTCDALIESTDVLPTLFEWAHVPEPRHCQGRSFAPLLSGSAAPYTHRDAVFAENVIPEVITGGTRNFRFDKGQGVGGIRHPDAKMMRTRKWKINYYPGYDGELYDLENDPSEARNLYTDPAYQATVAELKGRLLDWMITADETEQIAEKWLL